ncbi:MAG: M24 family metallopeptidase [Promethearchaeota archaeon]
MRLISQKKFEKLLVFMENNGIDVLLLMDFEMSKDINVQYLSGHPMDGAFILTAEGDTLLIPWDISIARKYADVDLIIDLSEHDNSIWQATSEYLKDRVKKTSPVIGVNKYIPYIFALQIEKRIQGSKVYKNPVKISQILNELRSTKSDYEMDKMVEVAKLSNKLIIDINKFIENATNETENDLSFYVIKKMREYGAEDNSFPSLVANAKRSHEIHCHPYAGNNKISEQGIGLIDFGAKLNGYCSDVTIPFSFGSLTEIQKKIKKATLSAYETAINMIELGTPFWKIHHKAKDIIKKAGFKLVTALGHGLGLSEHDSPAISGKPTDPISLKNWQEIVVEEGMVFTIEPNIGVEGVGGFRLENDFMMRNGKLKVLTNAKPVQIE